MFGPGVVVFAWLAEVVGRFTAALSVLVAGQ
jgi:hypothetical protein